MYKEAYGKGGGPVDFFLQRVPYTPKIVYPIF